MSEKNSEGRRAARERMQDQRDRDKVRDKRKRVLMVGAAGVAVLGIAAAVGVAVTRAAGDDPAGTVVVPTGANGEDSLAIPVGKPAARATLTVYEDFRCPACAQFENDYRATIHRLQDKGQLKIEYHLATIIDGNMGGRGSLNAANAAACAQDVGKFVEYHDVLYQNQPVESADLFADKDRLIELAGKVDGLVTAKFEKCVDDGAHDSWVEKANAAFGASGHQGTPTVLLDGQDIYSDPQKPLDTEKLKKLVAKAVKS